MNKNIMYEVTNGWIRWHGKKHTAGSQFIATNPSPAEQMMLDSVCKPVVVASLKVNSKPVKLTEPKAEEPQAEEPEAIESKVDKPEVEMQDAGKKNKKKSRGE